MKSGVEHLAAHPGWRSKGKNIAKSRRDLIAALRSAASALEHGRLATAKKKLALVASGESSHAAALRTIAGNHAANPGVLEEIIQEHSGVFTYCETCGADSTHYLEPAFDPAGEAKVLCMECRIGSAESLADRRAEMEKVLRMVVEGNTRFEELKKSAAKAINPVFVNHAPAPSGPEGSLPCVYVDISGGVLQGIDGLPQGFEYAVIDWDNIGADPEGEWSAFDDQDKAYIRKTYPEDYQKWFAEFDQARK